MTDIHRIPENLGEDLKVAPVEPPKKVEEDPGIFNKEREKKARTVSENDDKEKQKQQEREIEKQVIAQKPKIEAHLALSHEEHISIFDQEQIQTKPLKVPNSPIQNVPISADPQSPIIAPDEKPLEGVLFKDLPEATEKVITKPQMSSIETPILEHPKPQIVEEKAGTIESKESSTFQGEEQPRFTPKQETPDPLIETIKEKQEAVFVDIEEPSPIEIPPLHETVVNNLNESTIPLPVDNSIDPILVEEPSVPLDLSIEAPPVVETEVELAHGMTIPFAGPIQGSDLKKNEVRPLKLEAADEFSVIESPNNTGSSEQGNKDSFSNQSSFFQSSTSEGSSVKADAPIGFDRVPPHILNLFDRLVGVISVLQMQGKSETILHLNAAVHPDFAGTSVKVYAIKLTEYDTAASCYNIEFIAPPESHATLQKNIEGLKKRFDRKGQNFEIGTIEVSLPPSQNKQE